MPRKLTRDQFIERAKAAHGDKFDYSAVEYVNANTKVTIICPEHGEFEQRPSCHMRGEGCNKCARELSGRNRAMGREAFIERSKSAHGDKFDYSKVQYVNKDTKVTIICPEHGEFEQRVDHHMRGAGCPLCAGNAAHTRESLEETGRKVHGPKFDYSKALPRGAHSKVIIICPEHGEFEQTPDCHLNGGHGCPSCANAGTSAAEQELAAFIESLGVPVVQNDKTLLNGKELDILCPLHGVAIEYNGLYWHSDLAGKPKNYHLEKTRACNAAGFRLIHIFEGDNIEQAKKLITHALGARRAQSIYARKCTVRTIDSSTAKDVLSTHHPQGYVGAATHLGTYCGEELVAVTSFGTPFRSKLYKYELKRHVAVRPVIGGLGKVVKHFKRRYMLPGEKLGSLCDLSRFDGKSYKAAGFDLAAILPPDYQYAVGGKRVHKSRYQKSGIARLLPEHYDAHKTEREMMESAGIGRVYDCGKARYIFTA